MIHVQPAGIISTSDSKQQILHVIIHVSVRHAEATGVNIVPPSEHSLSVAPAPAVVRLIHIP